MKTKLNLIPLSKDELDKMIDESDDGTVLVVKTVEFIKVATPDSIDDGFKPNIETLAVLAEVGHNMNGDFVWRLNRNTFRSHEFDSMEEHQWRIEPRYTFSAFAVDDSEEYLQKMIALSMGCTYNLDTDEWHGPKYTWKITNKNE